MALTRAWLVATSAILRRSRSPRWMRSNVALIVGLSRIACQVASVSSLRTVAGSSLVIWPSRLVVRD